MKKKQYWEYTKNCPHCGHTEKKKAYTSLMHRCTTCENDATVFHYMSSGKLNKAYCDKCAFKKDIYRTSEFIFHITYYWSKRQKLPDYEKARLRHNFFVFIPDGINILDTKTVGRYIRDEFWIKDWNKKPYK